MIQGSATIWGATVLIALAIIGVSVYVATSGQQQPKAPQPAQAEKTAPARSVTQETGERPAPQRKMSPVVRQERTEPTPTRREEPARQEKETEKAATGPATLQLDNLAGTLSLSLPFMEIRNKIPLDHTCYRRNESPEMNWAGAPPATKSYVVFLERRTGNDDGRAFVTWALFNIPANATGLGAAQSRDATLSNGAKHAMSDHNNIGYIGPCEPKGRYGYAMRVFALDTVLDVPAWVGKDDLIRAMNGHIIDAAEQEFTHYKTY